MLTVGSLVIQRTLVLSLGALILYVLANVYPFMTFKLHGLSVAKEPGHNGLQMILLDVDKRHG